MKQNWKQRLIAAGVCGCLLLASALPASAADFAEDITPDMTMQEIRSDPVMQQSGLFLYGSFGEGTQWTRSRLENQTLQEYAWGQTVPETTAALNLAAQNVKDGVQVTWQVYSPEETEVDPGIFANQKRGYGAFGAQKPGALILGYPIVDFSIMKPVYHIVYDPTACGWRYYWTNLDQAVDDDYPPVYFWRGDNDTILGPDTSSYEAFEQALQKHGVTYQRTAFADAPHAVSIGRGTDADGWLDDATAFWEEQVK